MQAKRQRKRKAGGQTGKVKQTLKTLRISKKVGKVKLERAAKRQESLKKKAKKCIEQVGKNTCTAER